MHLKNSSVQKGTIFKSPKLRVNSKEILCIAIDFVFMISNYNQKLLKTMVYVFLFIYNFVNLYVSVSKVDLVSPLQLRNARTLDHTAVIITNDVSQHDVAVPLHMKTFLMS